MKLMRNRIEQILDETDGSVLTVIVQMSGGDQLNQLLAKASETIERRRAVVNARVLLPDLKDAVSGDRGSRGQRRGQGRVTRRSGIDVGQGKFRLLQGSNWFGTVNSKGREGAQSAVFLRSAGAMVIQLTRDELSAIPDTLLTHIRDIAPNREVRTPPISRAVSEPRAVSDSKGHTWGIARTGAMACWGAFNARGKGVKVAVLDTGIDAQHADLQGKVDAFAEFDGSGRLVTSGVENAYDSASHGTHCAGSIVGGQNSRRFIGMAPEARILAGLVLKNGSGTDAQILAGIEWAIQSGADVISMSLGGLSFSPDVLDTYTAAIISANDAGIPVVVAVGNDGNQTTGAPGNDYFAFTVGATDIEDRAAGFSGGRTQVIEQSRYIESRYLPLVYMKPDITAPGVDIFSAVPGGGYETWSGTSMATPHVAGAMALLLSGATSLANQPGFDRVSALQTLLISTVKELGEAGQNHRFGYGRLDVLRAMGYAHFPDA